MVRTVDRLNDERLANASEEFSLQILSVKKCESHTKEAAEVNAGESFERIG